MDTQTELPLRNAKIIAGHTRVPATLRLAKGQFTFLVPPFSQKKNSMTLKSNFWMASVIVVIEGWNGSGVR